MTYRTCLVIGIMLSTSSLAWAQQMYRCTTKGEDVIYQDKPCAAGTKESMLSVKTNEVTGPVKVHPQKGLSVAQLKEYEQLMQQTYEVFRVVGRAQACKQQVGKLVEALLTELHERHGDEANHGTAGMAATMGMAAGMENRATQFDRNATPPSPDSCSLTETKLRTLSLPSVPASLVLRADAPDEITTKELATPGGSVRFVMRTPLGGGQAKTVVLFKNKAVFESINSIDYDRLVGSMTPVLLVASKDREGRCGRTSYVNWHAITLPRAENSTATELKKTNCLTPTGEYQDAGESLLCFLSTSGEGYRSQIYSIDKNGELHERGSRSPGVCPH